MVIRSLIDKSTTIKMNTTFNYGLNPICMLSYGTDVTRALIHFDVSNLKKMYKNRYFTNTKSLTHKLLLKNCASINPEKNSKILPNNDINCYKERAVSFTVLALKVNKEWDMGVGFDNIDDTWIGGKNVTSKNGATWFNATTEKKWDNVGIYTDDYIETQYESYLNNDEISGSSVSGDTIIVGMQKFDVGNENFEIDITEYVNRLINDEEENYGICLMFTPQIEDINNGVCQYVGFFNEKTNTIFTPVLETRYDNNVNDNRFNFYLNKNNRLYLYSIIDDKFENLDTLPVCTIDGVDYEVKQQTKGIYYVDVKLNSKDYKPNQIIYDTWSNIIYQGEILDDVEMEFVTHSQNNFFKINETVTTPKTLNPLLVGINNEENITMGEIRMNKLFFKIPYTHSDYLLNNSAKYRIYVKDGDREVTIIDWDYVMNISKCGLFTIDTSTLPSAQYYIDINVDFGEEKRIFKNVTTFKIVSDVTKQKR